MLKKNLIFLVTLLAVSTVPCVFADDTPEVKALKKDMPQDVMKIIDRTVACNRWRGEEPTSKDQIEKVNKQLSIWGCDTIDADQVQLAKRYNTNYEIKLRVQKAKDIF
jgi:glutathione peroxidase-family protein